MELTLMDYSIYNISKGYFWEIDRIWAALTQDIPPRPSNKYWCLLMRHVESSTRLNEPLFRFAGTIPFDFAKLRTAT